MNHQKTARKNFLPKLMAAFIFMCFVVSSAAYVIRVVEKSTSETSSALETTDVVEIPPENTYVPVSIDGFTLWSGEAQSRSCYPDGLDMISENDGQLNHYINNVHGYSFDYPSDWTVDNHAVPYYTRFFSVGFRLDVTVQNVNDAWTTASAYMSKTINPIKNLILSDERPRIGSLNVRVVNYSRPLIPEIKNDMNYYSYYFITNKNIVYTFQLKTNQENFEEMTNSIEELISSFKIETIKKIDLNSEIKNADIKTDLTLKHEKKTLSVPANTFMMGVFKRDSFLIEKDEKELGLQFGMQMFYKAIDSTYDAYTKQLTDNDKLPVITFLFEEADSENHDNVIQSIINGKYDKTLTNWAEHIAVLDAPVLIRPGNEMNGDWVSWSLKNNFNDPDLYKLAFRYLVNLFKLAGADNAYFIWNPNHSHEPYYSWTHASMFYPGDDFVDFVGITYYNYGFENFKSFKQLYDDYYWEYSRSFFQKPLVLGEFGTVEEGGNKAQWITDMFDNIPTLYPNIKLATWFDAKHTENSKYDLQINTSQKSLDAFRNGLNLPTVIKRLYDTQQ